MNILVDTSVWIDYFRSGLRSQKLDLFIDENTVVTNDLILAELIPYLKIKKKFRLIQMLLSIRRNEIVVDWEEIVDFQYHLLKTGINGVGIADLIIFQNSRKFKCPIYSLDSHFKKMAELFHGEFIE